MERLSNFHFVRKVEPSLRKEIRMDFTQILPELREEIEKRKLNKKRETIENPCTHFVRILSL